MKRFTMKKKSEYIALGLIFFLSAVTVAVVSPHGLIPVAHACTPENGLSCVTNCPFGTVCSADACGCDIVGGGLPPYIPDPDQPPILDSSGGPGGGGGTNNGGGGSSGGPVCSYANATCRTVALDVSCKENIYATVNGQSEQDACTASSNANNPQTVSNGGTSYNAPCRGTDTYSFDPRTSLLWAVDISSVGYDDSGSAGTVAGGGYYAWDIHNTSDCNISGNSCGGRSGTSCAGTSIVPKGVERLESRDTVGADESAADQ